MALDVQFWYTTSDKLEGLAIQDGRIIALSDKTGYYYDMGGKRYRANNLEFVDGGISGLDAIKDNFKTAVDSGVDATAILDLLYVTVDGIFRYNTDTNTFDALLPVDVKEVEEDDGYVYGRQYNRWNKLRWIFASDELIPVSSINARIAALLAHGSSSIKIAGNVALDTNNLQVTIGSEGKSIYLDLKDAEFQGNYAIALSSVQNSKIQIDGGTPATLNITGDGEIVLQSCKLINNVTANPFCGALKLINCTGNEIDIVYEHGGNHIGSCIISGCTFYAANINLPIDNNCMSVINANILDSTKVSKGGAVVDALYNNEGAFVS